MPSRHRLLVVTLIAVTGLAAIALNGSFRSAVEPEPEAMVIEAPSTRGLTGGNVAPGAEPPVVAAFPDGVTPPDYAEVPLFFATNRARLLDFDPSDPASQFADRDADGGAVTYGRMTVTIPHDHRMGNLESQSWLGALLFAPDPAKHVVLKEMIIGDEADVMAQVRDSLGIAENAILMYVHGYNTSLDKAARRAGQMTYDLAWRGPSFLFSWPSKGSGKAYLTDGNMARRSHAAMAEVLANLARTNAERIVVIGHSMGTRVLSEGLADLTADQPDLAAKITTVILAAPDIDEVVFRDDIAPRFRQLTDSSFTLYASSEDIALKASAGLNGEPRIGDTSGGVPEIDGIDVIDASNTVSDFFGHTYFGDNATILTDIYGLIHDRLPVDARPTVEAVREGEKQFWRIRLGQN